MGALGELRCLMSFKVVFIVGGRVCKRLWPLMSGNVTSSHPGFATVARGSTTMPGLITGAAAGSW